MNTEAKQLEEEWVINTANSSFKPRPTLSNAANLMIKAALPSNRQRNLSHEAAPFVPKRISTDDPIESLAKESLPTDLTDFLVTTYINEKPNANKAQKAATHEAHRKSMKNGLLECNNPVGLILVGSVIQSIRVAKISMLNMAFSDSNPFNIWPDSPQIIYPRRL
jgi:hypothetical protein